MERLLFAARVVPSVVYDGRMARDLIIDGYNLLHAAGLARTSYGPGDLERVRNRLVARLANLLTDDERRRTVIVFDAKDAPPGLPARELRQDISLRFANDAAEADDLIEQLIAEHSAPKRLVVISSDHRLQKAARRRKGKARDSDAFLDHLERRAERAQFAVSEPSDAPREAELSAEELESWMTEFGDIDLARIRREIAESSNARQTRPNESPAPRRTDPPDEQTDPAKRQIDPGELAEWERLLSDLIAEDDRDV